MGPPETARDATLQCKINTAAVHRVTNTAPGGHNLPGRLTERRAAVFHEKSSKVDGNIRLTHPTSTPVPTYYVEREDILVFPA